MSMITAQSRAGLQAMLPATPLVVVVEAKPDITETLRGLCDFLRIRVRHVPAGAALARELLIERPICILARTPPAGADMCDALAAIARHDPTLPVLLVTDNALADDEPDTAPPPLSNLYWVASRPGLRLLVEFLFMAERHTDTPGLMPIA